MVHDFDLVALLRRVQRDIPVRVRRLRTIDAGANNTIGDLPSPDAENVIAASAGDGVRLDASFGRSQGTVVRVNRTLNNTGLGISRISALGLTPNTGVAPIVLGVTGSGSTRTLNGGIPICANPAGCVLEIFRADEPDRQEGDRLLGTHLVAAGSRSVTVPTVAPHDYPVATLNDTNGTSAFSSAVVVP